MALAFLLLEKKVIESSKNQVELLTIMTTKREILECTKNASLKLLKSIQAESFVTEVMGYMDLALAAQCPFKQKKLLSISISCFSLCLSGAVAWLSSTNTQVVQFRGGSSQVLVVSHSSHAGC